MEKRNRNKPCLWIICPCYNEEEMLPLSMPRLEHLLTDMMRQELVSEKSRIVYVDDCSKDRTWDIICQRHEENPLHCGLHLGHNSGQQNALIAGIETSIGRADCTVTIDVDLQDDIQVIPEMVRHYREGYEIVYGVRNDRHSDTFFKRNTALGFYRLMRWLGTNTVYNHGDFRLMGSRAMRQLMLYRERTVFLRGIVPQLGFDSATVSYDRLRREAGYSKYPIVKLLLLAFNGVTSVSVKPIRLVSVFGIIFVFVAMLVACYAFYSMYKGNNISGWVSLILSIWFVGGCILTALGMIGEYIATVYLDVKQRPRYNITDIRLDGTDTDC